ncbi:hypothetical protein TDB9533_04762 [Thalassocella blandensis]|nr:hypothetical protein TDB9533_04762 [Thalassocella blandensis]
MTEVDYKKRVEFLEQNYGTQTPGRSVHSLEKHGAQTRILKQYRRVKHPDYLNPTTGLPGQPTKKASKFLSHKDHYYVLRKAILEQKSKGFPGGDEVFEFDYNIGATIKNLGSHSNRGPYSAEYLNKARVRFDGDLEKGKFFTAFPE